MARRCPCGLAGGACAPRRKASAGGEHLVVCLPVRAAGCRLSPAGMMFTPGAASPRDSSSPPCGSVSSVVSAKSSLAVRAQREPAHPRDSSSPPCGSVSSVSIRGGRFMHCESGAADGLTPFSEDNHRASLPLFSTADAADKRGCHGDVQVRWRCATAPVAVARSRHSGAFGGSTLSRCACPEPRMPRTSADGTEVPVRAGRRRVRAAAESVSRRRAPRGVPAGARRGLSPFARRDDVHSRRGQPPRQLESSVWFRVIRGIREKLFGRSSAARASPSPRQLESSVWFRGIRVNPRKASLAVRAQREPAHPRDSSSPPCGSVSSVSIRGGRFSSHCESGAADGLTPFSEDNHRASLPLSSTADAADKRGWHGDVQVRWRCATAPVAVARSRHSGHSEAPHFPGVPVPNHGCRGRARMARRCPCGLAGGACAPRRKASAGGEHLVVCLPVRAAGCRLSPAGMMFTPGAASPETARVLRVVPCHPWYPRKAFWPFERSASHSTVENSSSPPCRSVASVASAAGSCGNSTAAATKVTRAWAHGTRSEKARTPR